MLAMLRFHIVSDYDRKNWLKGYSVHIDKSTACEIYCHCLSIDLLNHTESYRNELFCLQVHCRDLEPQMYKAVVWLISSWRTVGHFWQLSSLQPGSSKCLVMVTTGQQITAWICQAVICSVMICNRFQLILEYFHLNNNANCLLLTTSYKVDLSSHSSMPSENCMPLIQ